MEQWKTVIWLDESTFTLFLTSGRVYVWRTPSQAYNPDCLLPRVKHGGGSIMVWAAISWYSVGPIITLQGHVTANDYVTVLGNQVHPMVQTLFPNDAIYQANNACVQIAHIVQDWFSENEDEVSCLPWPPQSPDINIIEPLWSVLESNLCARYPPPSSITELTMFFRKNGTRFPCRSCRTSIYPFQGDCKQFCNPEVILHCISHNNVFFVGCFQIFVHPM
ncbi:hypothetical protein B7P43_G07844 [Cryptotermes secundus]|uniref:Tc1-like transposase DDE domain-containing protein n=1 Tax=Cryptotermes secundus TaxID=105785 RepID=A0A2J7QF07_9NEOP|nr:hypothetical protein B7P43_G07844 [Cryptotermes secundus]